MRPPETRWSGYSSVRDDLEVFAVVARIMDAVPARTGAYHDRSSKVGEPCPWLSRPDRVEVTRTATAAGYSLAQIASALGCSVRSVVRYRTEI